MFPMKMCPCSSPAKRRYGVSADNDLTALLMLKHAHARNATHFLAFLEIQLAGVVDTLKLKMPDMQHAAISNRGSCRSQKRMSVTWQLLCAGIIMIICG